MSFSQMRGGIIGQPVMTTSPTIPDYIPAGTVVPQPTLDVPLPPITVQPDAVLGSYGGVAAFRNVATTFYSSSTSTSTVSKPAGTLAGDELRLIVTAGAMSAAGILTPTFPAGFTLIGGPVTISQNGDPAQFSHRVWVLRKRATASEPANYTSTLAASLAMESTLIAVSGAANANGQVTFNAGMGTGPVTATGITTAGDNCWVGFVALNWQMWGGSWSTPPGDTPTYETRMATGSGIMFFAEGVLGTAGSTGDESMPSLNTVASEPHLGILMSIEAATSPTLSKVFLPTIMQTGPPITVEPDFIESLTVVQSPALDVPTKVTPDRREATTTVPLPALSSVLTVTPNTVAGGGGGVTTNPTEGSAYFTGANAESLSRANNATLQGLQWGSAWIKPDTLPSIATIMAKDDIGNNREFTLRTQSASATIFIFNAANAVSGSVTVPGLSIGTRTLVTWYMDSVTMKVGIALNNNAFTLATITEVPPNESAPFQLGRDGGTARYYTGAMDSVCIGKNLPGGVTATIDAIRTSLWNGGVGKAYSQLTAQEKIDWGLISLWNLDELTSTRNDAHSTNHLTDNNTVTYAGGLLDGVAGGTVVHNPIVALPLTVTPGPLAAATTVPLINQLTVLTVTPNLKGSGTTVLLPALDVPRTLYPDRREADTTVSNITVVMGAAPFSITPNLVESTTTLQLPTLIIPQKVLPGRSEAVTTVPGPIQLNVLTVIPNTRAAITTVPTLPTIISQLTVTPDTRVKATTVQDPAVSLLLVIAPGFKGSATTVPLPALDVPITVTPNLRDIATTVPNPIVSLGAQPQTLIPDLRESTTTVPLINQLTVLTVFPGSRAAATTVQLVSLDIPRTLFPNAVAASTSVPQPALDIPTKVVPDRREALTTVPLPTQTTVLSVLPGSRAAQTTVQGPTAVLTLTVAPNAVPGASQAFLPAISSVLSVTLGSVPAGTTVSNPVLIVPQTLYPGVINSPADVRSFDFVSGATAAPGNIVSTTTVPDVVMTSSMTVTMGSAASATTVATLDLSSVLTVIPTTVGFGPSPLLNSLVAYYKLNEPADQNAIDAHTGGKTLTDQGVGTNANGRIGSARAFIAANYTALYRADTSFRFPTGDFTAQAWVNTPLTGLDSGYGGGLIGHSTPDAVGDWLVSITDQGKVQFAFFASAVSNPTGLRRTDVGAITANVWQHVAVRKSGSNLSIWVNGVSQTVEQAGVAGGWGNGGFQIGQLMPFSPAYMFTGLVDEVAVWSRGLTDGEIGVLASAPPYPFPPGVPPTQVFDPIVSATMTVVPNQAPSLTSVSVPAVGSVLVVSPGSVSAATSAFGPLVELPRTVEPLTITSGTQAFGPLVNLGGAPIVVMPGMRPALTFVYSPVMIATLTVVPNVPGVMTQTFVPAVRLTSDIYPDTFTLPTEVNPIVLDIPWKLSPNFRPATTTVQQQPSVLLTLTIAPDFRPDATQLFEPSLHTVLTVLPTQVPKATTVPNPLVSMVGLSFSVIPTPIPTATNVFLPTRLSTLSLFPESVAGATTVQAPGIGLTLTVQPTFVVKSTVVGNPVLSVPVLVLPETVTAPASVFTQQILLKLVVGPETIVPASEVFQPLLSSLLTIFPNRVVATAAVRDPTLILLGASFTVTPDLRVSSTAVFRPLLQPAEFFVQPSTISAATQVFDPSTELARSIEPVTILASTEVFAPDLDLGPTSVWPDFVPSTTIVPGPNLITALTKGLFNDAIFDEQFVGMF